MEAPVKLLKKNRVDAYTLALNTGDSYTAQLAAFLNGCVVPLEGAEESELVIEEPDF